MGGIFVNGWDQSVPPPDYANVLDGVTRVKCATFDPLWCGAGTVTPADGDVRFTWLEKVNKPTSVTGMCMVSVVQGSFTGDNNNKLGLYIDDGTTLTLVASTADDANIWKAVANVVASKAFSSAYVLQPGVQYVGAAIYNNSAQTTAPQALAASVTADTYVHPMAKTNRWRFAKLTAQTNLPSTQALSGLASTTKVAWFGVYQ